MGKKDASATKLPVDQYRKQIGEFPLFLPSLSELLNGLLRYGQSSGLEQFMMGRSSLITFCELSRPEEKHQNYLNFQAIRRT